MKLLNVFSILILFVAMLSFSACSDDDLVIEDEEEVITTLSYVLTSPTGDTATFSFNDSDGDGSVPPVYIVSTLEANTVYTGSLSLSNVTTDPVTDVTEEIEEEDEEHQFFFSSTISDLSIEYDDMDEDGNPIGLSTTLTTGAEGSGTMTIILRHEPAKSAANVSDGDITNAGGETDIEVVFDVSVQ